MKDARKWSLMFCLTFGGLVLLGGQSVQANDTVFGEDDREAMNGNNHPWATIGKIVVGHYNCTGTLVGRNIVLTAAHCITDDNDELTNEVIYFYPNTIDGKSNMKAVATKATWGGDYPWSYADWAVLELNEPLGDYYGYMGLMTYSWDLPITVNAVGYSGDFKGGQTAGIHRGCKIYSVTNYTYNHNCDHTKGASGGPIYILSEGKRYIIGVIIAERSYGKVDLNDKKQVVYRNGIANIAVQSRYFHPTISEYRKKEKEDKQDVVAQK